MSKSKVCLVILLAVLSGVAGAGEVWWAGGTSDFGTPANWGGGAMPGSRDDACINANGQPYPIMSSGTYLFNNLLDGYWAHGEMTMNDGLIGVSNLFSVGYYGGATASTSVFTMNGGTIGGESGAVPQQIWIGYHTNGWNPENGILNMTGGRIDCLWALNVGGGASNTTGQLNISGGQLNLVQFLNVANNGSKVDISGTGVLSLWNKWNGKSLAEIQAMIASGLITGNGQVGNVNISFFDNTVGGTGFALTAAPEPATMILLGLGGISLIRRRK